MAPRETDVGPLELTDNKIVVYRIGWEPDPFAWTPWQYANHGSFDGRWDDPAGTFRTLYLGDRLQGCLLEVLAGFRPDLAAVADVDAIEDNDGADAQFPTIRGGILPRSWLRPRRAGTAILTGEFVDVRAAQTVATLRVRFGHLAAQIGLPDLDTAAIKSSAPRTLTQAIAGWLYRDLRPPVTGVCFASRFGDDLTMWALFEQPGEDITGSTALTDAHTIELDADTPALIDAMRTHGLAWDG